MAFMNMDSEELERKILNAPDPLSKFIGAPPLPEWDKENLYNSGVLVSNWFEDRRQYQNDCCRRTGNSIYRSEYLPHCKNNYIKDMKIPPSRYDKAIKDEGVGWLLIRNSEDYCPYLDNYTTTYDLMHNWEVRRAGVKEKPWRTWKLIYDGKWVPELDNTFSFGNLTQPSFRSGPQLPLVPNDWDVYSNVQTEYQGSYTPQRYPDAYTLCRSASSKAISREIEGMSLAPKPDVCPQGQCRSQPKDAKNNNACCCTCYRQNAPRFHKTLAPVHMLKSKKMPTQNLFPSGTRNAYYQSVKHSSNPQESEITAQNSDTQSLNDPCASVL